MGETNERPFGVLIVGVYMIIQAVFSISYYSEYGIAALFLAGTFAIIGIGVIRGSKGAFIGTILISAMVVVLGFMLWHEWGELNSITVSLIIIGSAIIIYLTRKNVRDFFFPASYS